MATVVNAAKEYFRMPIRIDAEFVRTAVTHHIDNQLSASHYSICDSARLNRIGTHDQVNSPGFDSPMQLCSQTHINVDPSKGLAFAVSSLVTLLVDLSLSFSHLL